MIQFCSATRFDEMPVSAAPRSFSAPCPGRQAEARVAVDERQRDGDDDHHSGEEDSVLGECDPGHRLRCRREDRIGRDRLGAVVEHGDRLQHEHDADRRADAGQRRCGPDRPVHEDVENEAEDRRVDERDRDRERRVDPVAAVERDLMGDQDDWKLEFAVAAQVHEHVGDEHRHRAVGEVDDARAPVLEHETLAEDRVRRAGPEAKDEEEDVDGHGDGRRPNLRARPEAGGPSGGFVKVLEAVALEVPLGRRPAGRIRAA